MISVNQGRWAVRMACVILGLRAAVRGDVRKVRYADGRCRQPAGQVLPVPLADGHAW